MTDQHANSPELFKAEPEVVKTGVVGGELFDQHGNKVPVHELADTESFVSRVLATARHRAPRAVLAVAAAATSVVFLGATQSNEASQQQPAIVNNQNGATKK